MFIEVPWLPTRDRLVCEDAGMSEEPEQFPLVDDSLRAGLRNGLLLGLFEATKGIIDVRE